MKKVNSFGTCFYFNIEDEETISFLEAENNVHFITMFPVDIWKWLNTSTETIQKQIQSTSIACLQL